MLYLVTNHGDTQVSRCWRPLRKQKGSANCTAFT